MDHSDHVDYPDRVVRLKRWHSHRMTGESFGNTMDARADESLYKPSRLGQAEASIKTVKAGEEKPFDLIFTAGPFVLNTGTVVKFFMPGQGSLGTTPQLIDPDLPGYVQVTGPDGVTVESICDRTRIFSFSRGEKSEEGPEPGDMIVGPICIGFKIVNGTLKQGEAVRISVGKTSGFTWKRLAGRKEFKVIIELGHREPKMRLPEPVVIRILPLAPDHIDVFLPPSCGPDHPIRATVSIRDRYDNRVHYDGTVIIDGDNGKSTAHLYEGLGRVDISKTVNKPVRVRAACETLAGSWQSNWCLPAGDYQLYMGDLHAHDFNSTAEAYPSDVYQWARDEKRFDFLCVPVQVHRFIDNEKWLLAKHMNEYFLEEGRFVTFLGFEWQHSHYGDKVIHYLGGDMPYLPVDDPRYANPENLYEALRGTDAFVISHHPGYQLDLHVPGTNWDTVEADVDRLVEIWSMHGSSEGYDQKDRPLVPPWRPEGFMAALRQGLRMGIVGGSDTHTGRPGGSAQDARPYWGGLCAVWAEQLTRRSLFEAFRARRTYAITGARIALRFSVNGKPMGSEIPASKEYRLQADIWGTAKVASVQFLRNTEVVFEQAPDSDVCKVEFVDKHDSENTVFYHCRVTQTDGHLAVCSPVWAGHA